jgi:uncharacterized protein YabN with tetrapyrrole methylase and pyrophosphatase domain
MGDLLFAAVNAARLAGIDPELALSRATEKFTDRFCRMEEAVNISGRRMEDMTLDEMDGVWEQVKREPPAICPQSLKNA